MKIDFDKLLNDISDFTEETEIEILDTKVFDDRFYKALNMVIDTFMTDEIDFANLDVESLLKVVEAMYCYVDNDNMDEMLLNAENPIHGFWMFKEQKALFVRAKGKRIPVTYF